MNDKPPLNHLLHLGLCIITGGLWLPVYGILLVKTGAGVESTASRNRRQERAMLNMMSPAGRVAHLQLKQDEEIYRRTGVKSPALERYHQICAESDARMREAP